jgi:hypothetical protein
MGQMKPLLLAFAMALPALAQTYIVAGVVTDAAHNAPVDRARVTLFGTKDFKTAVTTGAGGRFSFEVPQGKYNLYAEHNEWRMQFGNPEPTDGFGSAIIAGPGQDTAHLAFRWYPPGAIFGKVTDEQGEPVRDATVQLIRDGLVAGRRRILPAGTTETDDRGEYRFGPLGAGTYYVVATGRPWHQTQAFTMSFPAAKSQGATAYPPTYYPGVTDSRDAAILTVKPGSGVQADVPLRATPGATVKIRCPGSGMPDDACQGQPTFALHGVGGITLPTQQNFDFTTESFAGVAPGRYTVQAWAAGMSAYKVVDVGSGEFTFNLTLQPAAAIAGAVTYKNPLPPHAREYIGIDNEASGGRGFGALLGPDGTFTFHVGGAPFRPRLYGTVPMFIEELSADGAAVKDGVVDLTDGAEVHLKILASDEMGNVKGFAMSGDRPAPAALVVLAPAAGSRNPADYRGFQTEYDGSFDYLAVPAGDYLIFAVDRLDLEYTNPDAIRPYLPSAAPVHIAAHAVVEQRVPVTAAKPN